MQRVLLLCLLTALVLAQSSCAKPSSRLALDAIVAQQIIRSQFCTLAKVRGLDKRVAPGETDTSSWSYSLTNKFTGRENQDSTIRAICAYFSAKHLSSATINSASVFRTGLLTLLHSVKLPICNEYHTVTLYSIADTIHQYAGRLAISQPITINDSLRLYYYEFGKYPSANAGFSVLKFTQYATAEPVYESSLWISCGPDSGP